MPQFGLPNVPLPKQEVEFIAITQVVQQFCDEETSLLLDPFVDKVLKCSEPPAKQACHFGTRRWTDQKRFGEDMGAQRSPGGVQGRTIAGHVRCRSFLSRRNQKRARQVASQTQIGSCIDSSVQRGQQTAWPNRLHFKAAYGYGMPDDELPAHCPFEMFEERLARLADNTLMTEILAQVFSIREGRKVRSSQARATPPDGPSRRQLAHILDLTKILSMMQRHIEEFRQQYAVMTNVWMVAKLRQLGRPLCSDLTGNIRSSFRGFHSIKSRQDNTQRK